MGLVEELQQAMLGCTCSVTRLEHSWLFAFDGPDGAQVMAEGWWRVILDARVALSSDDDGHQFGLPAPLDAQLEANSALSGLKVSSTEVDELTGDLRVSFGDSVRLDILCNSVGYESWHATFEVGGEARELLAGGGGELHSVDLVAPGLAIGVPLPPRG